MTCICRLQQLSSSLNFRISTRTISTRQFCFLRNRTQTFFKNEPISVGRLQSRDFSVYSLPYAVANSSVTHFSEFLLDGVFHHVFQLPWWTAIIAYAATLELIMLPVTRIAAKTSAVRENLKPEVAAIFASVKFSRERLQQERWMAERNLTPPQLEREFNEAVNERIDKLYYDNRCTHWNYLAAPLTQLVVVTFSYYALRHLSGNLKHLQDPDIPSFLAPDMLNEGIAWIHDLTIVDPYYVLPTCIAGFVLLHSQAIVQVQQPSVPGSQEVPAIVAQRLIGLAKSFGLSVAATGLILLPFAAIQPACISLYLTCVLGFSLLRTILLKGRFGHFLGVPKLIGGERDRPVRDIFESIMSDIRAVKRRISPSKSLQPSEMSEDRKSTD